MIETQAFPFEIKLLSEAGKVEGLASAFGNVDSYSDVVALGAFTKTLATHRAQGTLPAMLLHHDMKRPCGRWTELEQSSTGLVARGTLAIETTDGLEAYNLLKAGALSGLSIGFRATKARPGTNGAGREIVEAELLEISFVSIPANPLTRVSSVKSAPGPREIEAALRSVGLSNRQSKAATAAAVKALATTPNTETAALAAAIETARQRIAPYLKG